MSQVYDAIIVGAGPGGSALATSLARSGLGVLLLDMQAFPRDKTCGDALSPAAVKILRQLGQADLLLRSGRRIDGVVMTTPGREIIQAPIIPPADQGEPVFVIKRVKLDDNLRRLAIHAGCEFMDTIRITAVHDTGTTEPFVVGQMRGKRMSLRGRVIILAVGANVGLLRGLGLLPKQVEFAHAARIYFEGLTSMDHQIQLRFDGVPLPGYGWIFPLSNTSANVGAGVVDRRKGASGSVSSVLEGFLKHPPVADLLSGGRRQGPVRSYPLRADFHHSPVRRGRLLLIGEAAGLVNPFTGEGIDYALESAMIASESLRDCFTTGDFSEQTLSRYDQALRARFQRYFVLTSLMRRAYMNPRTLDALGRASSRWPDVARLIVDILMGRADPLRAFSPGLMLKILSSLPTTS